MFNSDNEKYLLYHFERNQALLFLGAGFSRAAKNKLGENIPMGDELSKKIFSLLAPGKEYEYTSLKVAYQALLNSNPSKETLKSFLENNLLIESCPDFYKNLNKIYWHKIYTTNIDNLIDLIYEDSEIELQNLSFPDPNFYERDQLLDKIQAIYLNGKLGLCDPTDLIFGIEQYALNANLIQQYYLQFISEYANKCTIFIGSSMEEDYMWQYIEERKHKRRDIPDRRLKSFLITPTIPHLKSLVLQKYNVTWIQGTAEDFCNWITSIVSKLPNKNTVLKNVIPSLQFFLSLPSSAKFNKTLKQFSQSFEVVPSADPTPSTLSYYLIGATPTWSDMARNLDAKRDITEKIIEKTKKYSEGNSLKILAVLGSAGCGKSTIIRRVAFTLSAESFEVFFSSSDTILPPQTLADAIAAFEKKVILIVDYSSNFISKLHLYIKELEKCRVKPIIIIASRLNDFDRLSSKEKSILELEEIIVPDLNRGEILNIIEKLEQNHAEGTLKGKRKDEQIAIFERISRRQILVAMKEATQGIRFAEIIEDEFSTINPDEAQTLCLCVSLATEAGYRLSKEQLIACSQATPADTLFFLERNLKGIVISDGISGNTFSIRHKIIAEQYIDSLKNKDKLKESYLRLLKALSVYKTGMGYYGFNLYKNLINHKKLFARMGNIDDARFIFEQLKDTYNNDHQFWHQYATLEMLGGNFDWAENYLLQAKELNKKDYYVDSSYGNLYMKRAIQADSATVAVANYERGVDILKNLISKHGSTDPYCYHILCVQSFNYINAWFKTDDLKRKKLSEIKTISEQATFLHPRHKKLGDLHKLIIKAELNLAIPVVERPTEPFLEVD